MGTKWRLSHRKHPVRLASSSETLKILNPEKKYTYFELHIFETPERECNEYDFYVFNAFLGGQTV